MDYKELIEIINKKLCEKEHIIVAIDGRCASGKTTLSQRLAESFECNVFHIDDFFLRPEQRTEARLKTPGGNFDIEGFEEEVISGILSEKDFTYRKFDCSTFSLGEEIRVNKKPLTVIEGSYSCHPDISKYWDMKIFVTTDVSSQAERIRKRNPDKCEAFFSKWIPMEEKYFDYFDITSKCDYIIST